MAYRDDQKTFEYFMVNGGINQIRTNIEMKINTRIQKKNSAVLLKNTITEQDCINQNWRDLISEINIILKNDDLELVHFNVDK